MQSKGAARRAQCGELGVVSVNIKQRKKASLTLGVTVEADVSVGEEIY